MFESIKLKKLVLIISWFIILAGLLVGCQGAAEQQAVDEPKALTEVEVLCWITAATETMGTLSTLARVTASW